MLPLGCIIVEIGVKDKDCLRTLAERVRLQSEKRIEHEKKQLWIRHNRMEQVRPMVLVFPENSWNELVPFEYLTLTDPFLRTGERDLRKLVYRIDNIPDDFVIEAKYQLPIVMDDKLDWGFRGKIKESASELTKRFPFESEEDFLIMKASDHTTEFDDAETDRRKELLMELFGDLLSIEPIIPFYTSSITWDLVNLRDMTTLMMDLAVRPDFFHQVMTFMSDAIYKNFKKMEEAGRLTSNATGQFLSSGTLGYSDELPRTREGSLKLSDLWGFADAQEFTGVSPAMFREMLLPYQKKLLSLFGLNYYACCEVIDKKLDDILSIPNLRKVSVSPWTDQRIAAQKIENKAIFCRKPDPSKVIYSFDADEVTKELSETRQITRDMSLEIVLKDLNTLHGKPERIGEFLRIANRLVEA